MAEKCTKCGNKISNFDVKDDCVVECPNCKNQYHRWCWSVLENCSNCGFENQELLAKKQAKEQARQEAEARRLAQERARQEAEQERLQARINHLKTLGKVGYYEYKVLSLVDQKGVIDTERLMTILNDMGLDGWKLQCAYTNEMGKNSLEIAGFGLNSTADQNILIFERFVKFE